MKALLLAGVAALACAFIPQSGREWVVVLGGDSDGMLSPCGCTQPMTGGIRRRASAVRMLTAGHQAIVLENSGLFDGVGRQSELKAQALAEVLRQLSVDAIHIGPSEAAGGKGSLRTLQTLAEGRLVTTSLAQSPTNDLAPMRQAGPFVIGGVSMRATELAMVLGERAVSADAAVTQLLEAARAAEKVPVLMLQGSLEEARGIARRHPELRLIQYRLDGSPPDQVERVGQTVLASSGEDGKFIVRLVWRDGAFHDYATVSLGPEFQDDPDASRIYSRYLQRVEDEKLIDRVVRIPSEPYAGTARCADCHADAARIWKGTEHAGALATLENDGHGRDPECVGCHVVGLDKEGGFLSRLQTPQLADVACESCHGPGLDHAKEPAMHAMGKVGQTACAPCHDTAHSPRFSFPEFWKRIAH